MLAIQKIDHVGIRVGDKQRSIDFYQGLGFAVRVDAGFEQGHPVIMEHPSGVVLNLLGPSTINENGNILMDVDDKYPGYTHIALRVDSLEEAKSFVHGRGIEITGSFQYKDLRAVFIRDPDRNVIELDEYGGDAPQAHEGGPEHGYQSHP